MTSRQWHYVIDGNQQGPIPEEQLRFLLNSSRLPIDMLVWTAGLSEWVPARSVVGLVEVVTPAYAGFWKRFGATFIDIVVVFFACAILGGIFGGFSGAFGVSLGTIQIGAAIAGIIIRWLYFAIMESSSCQATLGKMAVGINVTDMNGKRISFLRATGRHLSRTVLWLTLGIGYLAIAFTTRKQGLHDMIASTLVIVKPPR